jgi:acetyltransferase-like isoleucine patch superfamily enzyme
MVFVIINRLAQLLMRNKEGTLMGWDFFMWGIAQTAADCLYYLVKKFFINQIVPKGIYTLLGAKIGKNAAIYCRLWDPDLMEIGDNSILGTGCIIGPHAISQGVLYRKKITIGKNATIGAGTIILPGVTIEDNVIIASNSVIPSDQLVKGNAIYGGSPIRKIKDWQGENVWLKQKSE